MDVFEALGLDVPDNTRSMSVGDGDPQQMEFLSSIFGWNEKEASANSLILFPGESQQGLGDGVLMEVPSFNTEGSKQSLQQAGSSAGVGAAQPGQKVSPFSGISQFDLFLGDPAAPTAPAAAAGAAAGTGSTAIAQEAAAPQADMLQGLLELLQESQDAQQQQQQQPALSQFASGTPHQQLLQQQQQQTQLLQQQQPAIAALQPNPQGLAAGATGLLALQQQQQVLMPPPLPQLPLQAPQQPLQQQQPGLLPLQQPQLQVPSVISPLLLQPMQLHMQQVQHLGLPGQPFIMPQQQQQLLQQPVQPPVKQEQQQDEQYMYDADAGGTAGHVQPAAGQPKRRGRPPKNPGQYSKGYEAIKRYREKKKGMVEHMEAEIAEKRQELQRLLAEQEALRSHQQHLESSMSKQDQLLAQLLQLKLTAAGKEDSNDTPDLEATTAAAMAGVQQALAMQNGGDTAAAQAAAAAVVAERRSKVLLKQQQVQHKVMAQGPVFLRRYQAYVQAVADRLAQAGGSSSGSAGGGSSNPAAGEGSQQEAAGAFPTFPFTLNETLSLWTLSRLAIMTRTNALKREGAAGVGEETWDDFTLNLSTGQHDLVSNELWKGVAQQIPLTGEQQAQLRAAWRVYATAMINLNQERQVLLQQLQQAMAAEEAGNAPAFVGRLVDDPSTTATAPSAAALGAQGASSSSSASAAAVAAGAGGGVNCTTASSLDVAFVYLDLLDAIDRNLLRGRAVVMMFGWSILSGLLSAEQIGRVCVVSWPYFPLIRAVVGYMLGKQDLTP